MTRSTTPGAIRPLVLTLATWAVAALAAVVIAGCGSSGQTVATNAQGENDRDLYRELSENRDGTSFMVRAGLGDDVAVIRADYEGPGARRPAVAGYRTPEGAWHRLPLPDVLGGYELAGVGDSVMLGGYECVAAGCERLRPRFLVLSDDRKSWLEVLSELPEIDANFTNEGDATGTALAYPRVMDVALFTLSGVDYAVDPEKGPVMLDYAQLSLEKNFGFFCTGANVQIMVPGSAESLDSPVRLDGVVLVQDLQDPSSGFVAVAEAPKVEVDQLSSVCGYRAIALHSGDTEYYFDLEKRDWSTRQSNYQDVNDGITTSAGERAQQALPDGTAYDGSLQRAPDGTWTKLPPYVLVTTRSGVVYAFGEEGVVTLKGAS